MYLKVHKVLIIISILCFLINPLIIVSAREADIISNNQMELIRNDVKVNDLDIEPIDTTKVKKNVIPDTKKEGKKVLALFLKTMLWVIACGIAAYILLIFYKKYDNSAFITNDYEEEDYEALDLSTPDNRQDALKSFLNRTK